MPGKTRVLDVSGQLSLLDEAPEAAPGAGREASGTGRVFVSPDRNGLRLCGKPVCEVLRESGNLAPLAVAELLDGMDWSEFESAYAETGRAPYSPRLMVGLVVYGTMEGVGSLRCLERMAGRDLGCMWVTGGIVPDHACIGKFLTRHAELLGDGFFEQLTAKVLAVCGSDNRCLAGDGTVVEAACSQYRLLRGEALREHAEAARAESEASPDNAALRRRAELAEEAGERLEERAEARRERGRDPGGALASPTEPEAVVQRQKRGRGSAASHKPSVLANAERVVVAHAVDPSSEVSVVGGLLDLGARVAGRMPDTLLLDAGYFGETVISAALERGVGLLCPDGRRPGERRGVKGGVHPKGEFSYIEHEDAYRCPAGELLRPGAGGYSTPACGGCALRGDCTASESGRVIVRRAGDELREAMREVMGQPGAQAEYRARQGMVEPVFASLRQKQGLGRFRRRGLAGARLEFSLHVLAHNLGRAVAAMEARSAGRFRRITGLFARIRGLLAGFRRSGWPGRESVGLAA